MNEVYTPVPRIQPVKFGKAQEADVISSLCPSWLCFQRPISLVFNDNLSVLLVADFEKSWVTFALARRPYYRCTSPIRKRPPP